jgi:hypothetical protein
MSRGVALSLVGSVALVILVGCGRSSWFESREPWRHDAEVECLKSGSVKEGPALTRVSPIQGPGICGADFPLKVTALAENSALGFADDPRPPGAIPQFSGRPPPPSPPYSSVPYGQSPYPPQRPAYEAGHPPGTPMSINPPGIDPDVEPDDYPPPPPPPQPTYRALPPAPAADLPPLGPARGPGFGTATPIAVVPTATLACPIVSALDSWIATGLQPSAMRWFGQPVVEIKQISAYSCRSMNGQRGAPISEHAFGNALDMAAFTLADGRKVTVKDGWHGRPEERGFLHDIHAAACRQFSTVLAPGSNRFHYDHIHVDLSRRASGRTICNPAPIPGDLVARRRGDPGYTGSIARGRTGFARERGLPTAVPGEDWE